MPDFNSNKYLPPTITTVTVMLNQYEGYFTLYNLYF